MKRKIYEEVELTKEILIRREIKRNCCQTRKLTEWWLKILKCDFYFYCFQFDYELIQIEEISWSYS